MGRPIFGAWSLVLVPHAPPWRMPRRSVSARLGRLSSVALSGLDEGGQPGARLRCGRLAGKGCHGRLERRREQLLPLCTVSMYEY